jgi:hypothetical protein
MTADGLFLSEGQLNTLRDEIQKGRVSSIGAGDALSGIRIVVYLYHGQFLACSTMGGFVLSAERIEPEYLGSYIGMDRAKWAVKKLEKR